MGLESRALFLSAQNITKHFPQVQANDSISIDFYRGETHCLLGENGAGKSTLASILYGALKPDSGTIQIEQRDAQLGSPRDGIENGIGLVHQHFVLVPALSVVENIVVGTQSQGLRFDADKAEKKIKNVCEMYGIDIDLKAKVWQLSVGEQQWVEILKALYLGIKLLILDEPTASLTLREIDKLFSIMDKMKKEGLAIILITHKLREVMEVADTISVLRKGKLVATVPKSQVNEKDLARMMVGRDIVLNVDKTSKIQGDPLLEIKGLRALGDKGIETVRGIDLVLHKGEILGIAGVAGNGQNELFETIIGVRKSTSGDITLGGEDLRKLSPREILNLGIAHIPEDRIREGLVMDFPIRENLVFGLQNDSRFRKGIFLNEDEISAFATESIKNFEIAAPSERHITKFLSGGNLQRVILARELSTSPKCIIANQPTRGLDIAACEYVYKLLIEQRDNDAGVLLFSDDLQELLSLSDRIGVIYRGEILNVFHRNDVTLEQIGLLMGGIRE